jgi:hypothetical protein
MKLTYSLILAAAASGLAFGQTTAYTTPVGYVTETLSQGGYNLLGLTLQQTAVAAGVFTAKASNAPAAGCTLTVAAIDFTTPTGTPAKPLLDPLKTYILELPDGSVQELAPGTWGQHTLVTPEDISPLITVDQPTATPPVVGTKFVLRPAATVTDIFGAQNTAGLKPSPDGGLTDCDLILVPTGGILLGIYFFNDGQGGTGWYTDQQAPGGDIVLAYPDGFYVQRRPAVDEGLKLTITGEVKKTPTGSIIATDYNYLGGVAPVGLTLATSGISNYITASPDGDPLKGDNVMLAKVGGYTTCYYFDDGAGGTGWYTDEQAPADNEPITSGLLILNRGVDKPLKISVPSFYPSL